MSQGQRFAMLTLAGMGCLSAAAAAFAAAPESVDHRGLLIERVFEAFRSPPAEARPFVRWWWNHDPQKGFREPGI